MEEWVRGHEEVLWWLGAASAVTFAASLALVPLLVRRLPADYFVRRRYPWRERHPVARVLLLALKNLLAGLLLLAGFAMLFLPGQGLLTMFLGLTLLDFPGKRRLEVWLVSRRSVRRVVGWIRRRAGKPPLRLPPEARS